MVSRVRFPVALVMVLGLLAVFVGQAHASPPPPCQPAPCTCSPGPFTWVDRKDSGIKTFQDPHNVNATYKLQDALWQEFDNNSEWGGVYCNKLHGTAGFWWYSVWGPDCVSPYPSILTENTMVDSTVGEVYQPPLGDVLITRCAKWAWSTTEDATAVHCYYGQISIPAVQNQVGTETFPFCL